MWSIPELVISQVSEIQHFIVENAKTARRFLKQMNSDIDFSAIHILEMDKHHIKNQEHDIRAMLHQHDKVGLMSEAGLPCIADPGNIIVRMAHESGISVKPLIGPSSIIMALIASGLNGQSFKFNGYLPGKPDERKKAIQELERLSNGCTQLFIETPYRNDAMLIDLIKYLRPDTRLLVSSDITGESESIICRKISWWREHPMQIGKIPCMFGIGV